MTSGGDSNQSDDRPRNGDALRGEHPSGCGSSRQFGEQSRPDFALCLSDQVCMSMQDATGVDTNATLTLGRAALRELEYQTSALEK